MTASTGCGKKAEPADVAFVINGIALFWVIAEKRAKDGAAKYGVQVDVKMPAEGVADQKRMVEELLAQKVNGIAISPIDPVPHKQKKRRPSRSPLPLC